MREKLLGQWIEEKTTVQRTYTKAIQKLKLVYISFFYTTLLHTLLYNNIYISDNVSPSLKHTTPSQSATLTHWLSSALLPHFFLSIALFSPFPPYIHTHSRQQTTVTKPLGETKQQTQTHGCFYFIPLFFPLLALFSYTAEVFPQSPFSGVLYRSGKMVYSKPLES